MKIYRLDNSLALLFLIFPILCLAVLIASRFIFKKGVKITGVSSIQSGLSMTGLGYYISTGMILLGMFIIAFSLTKPQYGIKREKIISEGIDIMIALDVSGSMMINDFYQQTRIDGAKNILEKFVDKRKGDRLGLVIFSDSSFLKCPATLNYKLLKSVISKIHITEDKRTALGIGLASAINRLLSLKVEDKNPTKIVILVTDGKNNTGEISPDTATEIAVQTGIKIFTVGIGSDPQELDLDLLKVIAQKTNGKFFHAENSGELGPIFDEIDKLVKHKIETMEYSRFTNVGYKYSLIGVILLIIGILANSLFFKRLA